jgi:hypothetical protein
MGYESLPTRIVILRKDVDIDEVKAILQSDPIDTAFRKLIFRGYARLWSTSKV